MLTPKASRTAAALLLAAVTSVQAADGPVSSTPSTIEVEDCTVRFVNKSTYAAARAGIIAELPYEEGDIVQPGALVVRLRDEVAEANLALRTAQSVMRTPIDVAEKEKQAADLSFDAVTVAVGLAESAYPQVEVDRLRIVAEARELQVQQAEEELHLNVLAKDQAQAELETYRIEAEFGGLVTRVHKHVGEAVNEGDPIITIIDTSRVRVEGKVPYAQSRRVQKGDPVRIQLQFPDDRRENLAPDSLGVPFAQRPKREPLAEEHEVFAGRIGFKDVEVPDVGRINEVRIWAEVANRDNILLEGLPAVMRVQLFR